MTSGSEMKTATKIVTSVITAAVLSGCAEHGVQRATPAHVISMGGRQATKAVIKNAEPFIKRIAAEVDTLVVIDNATQRMARADEIVRMTEAALSCQELSLEMRVDLETARQRAMYVREKAKVILLWTAAEAAYAQHAPYEDVMHALRRLHAAIRYCRHQQYVPAAEQMELEAMEYIIAAVIQKEEKRYADKLAQVESALRDRQKEFVNEHALKDCEAAYSLLKAQQNKRMNFFCMRDDVKELVKAGRLTARVLGEARVDELIRIRAAELHVTCKRRLGRRGEEMYASIQPMQRYEQMTSYPRLSTEERTRRAEKLWQERGTEAILADGSERISVLPAEGD